jgi:hypothetical protein
MQKVIALSYILVLVYLCLSVPRVKYWPDGCKLISDTWIWKKPPILVDINLYQDENGGWTDVNWSFDWREIALRLSIPSAIFVAAFIISRNRREKKRTRQLTRY